MIFQLRRPTVTRLVSDEVKTLIFGDIDHIFRYETLKLTISKPHMGLNPVTSLKI